MTAATAVLLSVMMFAAAGCATYEKLTTGGSPVDILTAASEDVFGAGDQVYSVVSVTLPRHSGYQPIEDKTAYATLRTDDQREAYAAIEESVFRVTNEAGGTYGRYALKRAVIPPLSSGEIFMVKEAVLADHPEAFWVNGTYSLGFNMHDGNYIIMYTNFNYSRITERLDAVCQAMTGVLKEIPGGASEFERELMIHDILVRDTEYDEEAAKQTGYSYVDAANVYGTLVNRKALCGGYSCAMKLLLNRVGISCSTVKGISKDVGHMWNIVRIDDEWYHLDTTWNDPITLSADNVQKYDYFNVTDEAIKADHQISENYDALTDELIASQGGKGMNFFNFDMPECVSDKANYYKLNAVSVSGLDKSAEKKITDRMKEMSLSGETAIYLMFPDDVAVSQSGKWLDETLVSAMSEVNRAAKQNGGRRISQCMRGSRDNDDAAWSSVYCVKLIFENTESQEQEQGTEESEEQNQEQENQQ